MKKITIGIFGAGTVGGGVIEIIEKQKSKFQKLGLDIYIKKCGVRNPEKYRDQFSSSIEWVTNINDILNDPEIDIVVECIGGIDIAKDIVFGALNQGKPVVTANKALLAAHWDECQSLSTKNEATLAFEAAVGGGLPIIRTMNTHLKSDNIQKISGILNGTTNFILSKMDTENVDYDEVLKEAQALGFAEADPTADVEGYDIRAKIAILANLAWDTSVDETTISTKGISKITLADFEKAHKNKATIKLLATAEKKGENIKCSVSPVIVPYSEILGQINGATNIVSIQSEFLGETTIVGQGAGRFPTANSVVTDIIQISNKI